MAGLLVEFGAQAGQVLGVFGDFVGFASGALAEAFFVVEAVGGNVLARESDGKCRGKEAYRLPCSR